MKKSYKIDVDCAACALKMEDAAKKTPGVKDAVVNFMALKISVEFEEGADHQGSQQHPQGSHRVGHLGQRQCQRRPGRSPELLRHLLPG